MANLKVSEQSYPSTRYTEAAAPSTPASGEVIIYAKADGNLYQKDDAGIETQLSGGGGDITTDVAWAAKGDLIAATGNNAAAILTVGSNDKVLMADSGQSTGLKWVASQTPSTQAFSDAAAEGTADTYARGDHVHGMPASPTQSGPPPVQYKSNQVAATSGAVTLTSPAQTSIYFACINVLGNFTISSITQTNVTWTSLKTANNGTSARVYLWKGVPTGSPGTTVTVNPSASATFNFSVVEFATGHGLAGTLDQSSDVTGTAAFQRGGVIVPTASNALVFAIFGNSSGAQVLPTPGGPFYTLIDNNLITFSSFGYAWSGKHPISSFISFQTNAAHANTIVSVI